jgi:ABC-2 type transport system permease protein
VSALGSEPRAQSALRDLAAQLALVPHVAAYEWRKVTAFRLGFLLREVLGGVARPAVTAAVYYAMFQSSGASDFRGYRFIDLVGYLVWSAAITKCLTSERTLDIGEQIFDGYITKYLVMPVSFFTLAAGRFVQFTTLQLGAALVFYGLGAGLLPSYWPEPASALALLQAFCLMLLGAACYFLLNLILQLLAFWLDVVWSLTNMFHFVALFVSGMIVPVSLMPGDLQAAFAVTFPYWTVFGPIELLLGRMGSAEFGRGVLVLSAWLLALCLLARITWRRGVLRYAGVGA